MRRRLPFLRLVIGLSGALLAVSALVLTLVRVDRVVIASGTLAGGSVALRSPQSGRILRVLAHPGEHVAAGAPLFELDESAVIAERAQVAAELESLEVRARSLDSDYKTRVTVRLPETLEIADLDIARAQVDRESAERRVESLANLRTGGLVPELTYQDALGAQRSAELAEEGSRLARTNVESTQRAELALLDFERSRLESDADAARARLAELDRLAREGTISAPVAGIWIGVRVEDLLGGAVAAGDEVGRIAHGRPDRFEGTIDDLGRTHVASELPVKLRVEGYPWLLHGTVAGRVRRVDERGEPTRGFPVDIALSSDYATYPSRSLGANALQGELYEGMRAEARILVEERVSLARLLFEHLVGDKRP